MPAAESTPAVDLEADGPLRIDCYVRPSLPVAVTETVNGVVERLERLADADRIADYRLTHWPPECHAIDATATDRSRTRDELVTVFERWASHQNLSLEPAFRRREVPVSPFGAETDESRERVRVPVVALAVRRDDESYGSPGAALDPETLEGVVPYTERPQSDRSKTYTVDEWLTIVGPDDRGGSVGTTPSENSQRLEGRQ